MEKEDKFQTLNMIYKIEKIKKRKQKYPKKMDMLDTLENPSANITNSILTGDSNGKSIVEPFDQNSSAEKTKIIEPIINLKDKNNWDQLEDIQRKNINNGNEKSFNENMKDRINKAYADMTSLNRHIAIFIAIAMSGRAPQEIGSINSEREWWGLPKTTTLKEDVEKEGFSWDSDVKDSTDSRKDTNIDYKLQTELELEARTKNDEFAQTEEYIKTAANKLLGGETIDGGASRQDIDLIQKYVGWFEAFMLASYSVYNWYFLMFNLERGKGENDDPKKDRRYRPTRKYFDDIYNERVPPQFIGTTGAYIILFLFEFPLFFPEMLDKILFDIVPKYSKTILNGSFCFIILLYLLFYVFSNYLKTFKDCFIDYLDGNLNNPILGIILFVMIFLFVISLFKFGSAGASKISSYLNQKPPTEMKDMIAFTQVKMMDEANKIATSAKKFNLFSIANFIILDTIVRLIILIIIGVPTAIFLIGIYLIVYSLFGIFIYDSPLKKGPGGFWKADNKTTFDNIIEHIKKNSGNDSYEPDPTTYMEYFNNVLVLMNKLSIITYDKIFTIGYLLIFIISAIDFLNLSNIKSVFPIKNLKMKELLIVFILVLFFAIASYAYNTINFESIKEILNPKNNNADKTDTKYDDFLKQQENYKVKQNIDNTSYILERERLEREGNKNLNILGFRTNVKKPLGQKLFDVGEEINLTNVNQNATVLLNKLAPKVP
jgi:hypothetical protein